MSLGRQTVVLLVIGAMCAISAPANEAGFQFALAKLLVDEGAYNEAGRSFRKAVDAAPDDAFLRVEYADFLISAERLEDALVQLAQARQLAPSDPEVAKSYGLLQLQAARENEASFAEARSAFEQLRALTPGDLEAMSTLGRIYLSEQRFLDAADVFREVLTFWPRSLGTHGSLIDALLRAGRPTEAEAAIEDLLSVAPGSIRARLTLADLRRQRGDASGARSALVETPRDAVGDRELYRRLALDLYEGFAFHEALYWLDRSLKGADDDGGSGRFLRGLLLAATDRPSEAIDALSRLLDAEPDRADAVQLLARLHLEASEWAAALAVTTPRLSGELESADGELALLHAEALAGSGLTADALDWLSRSASLEEVRPRALGRQAEILLEQGRGVEADEILATLTADGGSDALLLAAEVCQRQEDYARSVPFLERLVVEDEAALQAIFWLGAAYERTGRVADAETQFQRFLTLRPESAPALNYLGYMWAENGVNLTEALAMVEKAVSLDPDNGAYIDSLGWAHFKLGNYAEAKDHLERAADLVDRDPVVFEHLGDVYAVLGRLEDAERFYLQALEMKAENAQAIRDKLDRLDQR